MGPEQNLGSDRDDAIPEWVADVAEHICGCIEYRWNCHTEWCYVPPRDNPRDVHMIELAPAPLELTDREDDAQSFRLGVENFDILAMQQLFDEVDELTFRQPLGVGEIVIHGSVDGEQVRVVFYPAQPPRRG